MKASKFTEAQKALIIKQADVREQLALRRRHFARHGPTSESRVQSPMLRYRVMGSRVY